MKLLRSFGFALKGIEVAFIGQRNLRIHALSLSVVCAAAWYFSVTAAEWCLLLLTCGLVIGLELLSTALGNLTDLVSKEQHPLAGKAKGIAAGAVLFSSVIAVVVGVIIFARYIKWP